MWLIAVGIVHDAALAEDVVQEAAIIAYRKFGQFKPGTNFTAWMAQTVRYVALNESRREQRRTTMSLEHSDPDEPRSGPLLNSAASALIAGTDAANRSAAESLETNERLKAVLQEINPIARACLLLRTVDGLEYSQISNLLGIPEGTAMSHVHRTRKFLRDRLGEWADDPGSDRQGKR